MSTTVLIFAGGSPVPIGVVTDLPAADIVIAADSGYAAATALGYQVDVVVGDFDSIDVDPLPDGIEVERHPTDKDATDLELAMELAARRDPFRVVLVGAEGGRFDHEIGAVATLGSERWAAIPEIDWVRSDAIAHVIRGTRRIQGDLEAIVSLIPLGGDAAGVTTAGLMWDLDDETLYAGSSRGISNRFIRTEAVVTVGGGTLLGVLPNQSDD